MKSFTKIVFVAPVIFSTSSLFIFFIFLPFELTETGKYRKSINSCEEFGNLINHSSIHDGTVRSAKACFMINKFNPKSAEEVANILKKNKKDIKTIYEKEYPMFFEDKKLVNYCKEYHKGKEEWVNYCVSHIDMVDISADLWELSPILKEKYKEPLIIESPTFGKGVFEGWHRLKKDVEKELELKNG